MSGRDSHQRVSQRAKDKQWDDLLRAVRQEEIPPLFSSIPSPLSLGTRATRPMIMIKLLIFTGLRNAELARVRYKMWIWTIVSCMSCRARAARTEASCFRAASRANLGNISMDRASTRTEQVSLGCSSHATAWAGKTGHRATKQNALMAGKGSRIVRIRSPFLSLTTVIHSDGKTSSRVIGVLDAGQAHQCGLEQMLLRILRLI